MVNRRDAVADPFTDLAILAKFANASISEAKTNPPVAICAPMKKPIVLTVLLVFRMDASDAQKRPLNYGLLKPQDPATLPKSLAPFQKSVLKPKREPHTELQKMADGEYLIRNGWEMMAVHTHHFFSEMRGGRTTCNR